MAKFTGTAGTDTFNGTNNVVDEFDFAVSALSGSDTVNGDFGSTIDFIKFTTAGTVAAAAFANVSHIEELVLANGTNNITLTDALVGSSDNRIMLVYCGTGNDSVDGSAVTTPTNRLSFHALAGNDTLKGGAGNDLFYFLPTEFSSGDTLLGGGGTDNLIFTAAGTVGAGAFANVGGIEQIYLANGTNSVTLTNAMVTSAASHILTFWGGTGNDSLDASAVTTATNRVVFHAGAGNDALLGGAGNDVFYFAAGDLGSGDSLAAGGGTDNLIFTTAGTVAASAFANVGGIEHIYLANGANNVTLANALVTSATSHVLTVWGGTGNDGVFAGAVTTATNRVVFRSAAGNDTLAGGSGNDIYYLAASELTIGDTIAGGAGYDNLVFTTPGTVAAAALTYVSQVEAILLSSLGDNNLTLANATVGSALNHILTVYGGTGADTINAAGVTTPANRVVLNGGDGDDLFLFSQASLDSLDTVTGGAGYDTLRFTGAVTLTASAFAHVTGIEVLTLIGVGGNDIALSNAMVTSAQYGHLYINGTNGDDRIDASAVTDPFGRISIEVSGTGNDTFIGGAGSDTFQFTHGAFNTADHVDGGAGNDRLIISTDVATNFTAADLATIAGIEWLDLANPGYPMNVTISDALVASAEGHRLVVNGSNAVTLDASALTAPNSVAFNFGSAHTVLGGAGNDSLGVGSLADGGTLTGGTGDDSLRVGSLGNGATVDGGAGIDTLIPGAYPRNLPGVSRIEIVQLSDQSSQTVEITDSLVNSATGHLVTVIGGNGDDTIDASAVTTAGNLVVLNGGGGQDRLTGGSNANVFVYEDVSDSFGPLQNSKYLITNWDQIHGLDAAIDKLDLPDGVIDHNLPIDHVTGQVNAYTNADDIKAALDPVLGAHEVVLFHTTGDLYNQDLLVINPTDTAGYVAGVSYIIDVTGYSGTITPDLFI